MKDYTQMSVDEAGEAEVFALFVASLKTMDTEKAYNRLCALFRSGENRDAAAIQLFAILGKFNALAGHKVSSDDRRSL